MRQCRPCAEPFTSRHWRADSALLFGSNAGEAPNWQGRWQHGCVRDVRRRQVLGHKAIIKTYRASQSLWENTYFLQLSWIMAMDNRFLVCVFGIWKNTKATEEFRLFFRLSKKTHRLGHTAGDLRGAAARTTLSVGECHKPQPVWGCWAGDSYKLVCDLLQ